MQFFALLFIMIYFMLLRIKKTIFQSNIVHSVLFFTFANLILFQYKLISNSRITLLHSYSLTKLWRPKLFSQWKWKKFDCEESFCHSMIWAFLFFLHLRVFTNIFCRITLEVPLREWLLSFVLRCFVFFFPVVNKLSSESSWLGNLFELSEKKT